MILNDDYTRKIWANALKAKDEAFATFKHWKVLIEKQMDKKVKASMDRQWLGVLQ